MAVSGMLAGCSDNYLEILPTTDVSNEQLGEASIASSALDGLYAAMNTQYQNTSMNQMCGESYVRTVFGENLGNDYLNNMWQSNNNYLWTLIDGQYYTILSLPWMYYYNIVNQANNLIASIPGTAAEHEGVDNAVLNIKAQAYAMRAHAYTGLMTYWGQRWQDSDNGEAYCFPLRLEPGTDDAPLAQMKDVFKAIYDDCDEALAIMEATSFDRAGDKRHIDRNVVYGLKARAALLKQDWKTAADNAKAARDGYTLMDQNDLFAGFFEDCGDFMWNMDNEATIIYYWSWGSHYSVNGYYCHAWDAGGQMNIDLYNLMDPNDCRRKMYLMPDILDNPNVKNPRKLTKDDFWNPTWVSPSDIDLTITNAYVRNQNKTGMLNVVATWLYDYKENVFTGDKSKLVNLEDDGSVYYNYYYEFTQRNSPSATRAVRISGDIYAKPSRVFLGAQCKFWSEAPYGNSAFPWMRACEMALIEAEALCELQQEGAARTALEELCKKRISGYTCNKSGNELRDEIRNQRRFELWGEGFNFSDLKRWNLNHERRVWKANDPTSGNASIVGDIPESYNSPKYCNGWRIVIPAAETNYNKLIDKNLLKKINP